MTYQWIFVLCVAVVSLFPVIAEIIGKRFSKMQREQEEFFRRKTAADRSSKSEGSEDDVELHARNMQSSNLLGC